MTVIALKLSLLLRKHSLRILQEPLHVFRTSLTIYRSLYCNYAKISHQTFIIRALVESTLLNFGKNSKRFYHVIKPFSKRDETVFAVNYVLKSFRWRFNDAIKFSIKASAFLICCQNVSCDAIKTLQNRVMYFYKKYF